MPPYSSKKDKPGNQNSIIGGLFGLECGPQPHTPAPPFLTGKEIFFVNARSAIWLLIDRLRPLRVWVPSYLCGAITRAIDPDMTAVRFYEVDYDLKVRSAQWVSKVMSGDMVIFIDYFGFSYDRQLGVCVKEKGAWVLEDAAQALLSTHVGTPSDFVLFSPRKWIGVPDGGILRVPEGSPLNEISFEAPPALWWLKAFQASILRREFDDGLPNREWFKLFREAERSGPIGPYAMSQLSRTILSHSVDYSATIQRRIDNYRTLLAGLAEYAIFQKLEASVVPLGFPVRVARRDMVLQALFNHQIYPPVHWPIDGVVPSEYEDNHRLASHIMTLPCDQRYGREDMERIAEVFLKSV